MAVIVEAESYEQRLERMRSYFDHVPLYLSRGVYSNYNIGDNVVHVFTKPEGSYLLKWWKFAANLVTNDGKIFYAKKSAGETPATNENFFAGRMELRTGSATPAVTDTYQQVVTAVTGSRKTFDSTYPKTNDTGDTDNTGDSTSTVSYRVSWTTGDFTATGLIGGCIHDNSSPVNATKLLNHWSESSYDKDSSTTLKTFVNHTAS